MALDVAPRKPAMDEPLVEVRRSTPLYGLLALLVAFTLLLVLYLAPRWGGTIWDYLDPGVWALSGFFIWSIWVATDRRPTLVFDRRGLRDRRLGFDLLPWSNLVRAEAVVRPRRWHDREHGVYLHFRWGIPVGLARPRPGDMYPTNCVHIRMIDLDIETAELIAHIKRLAPHAMVDTSQLDNR